MGRLGADAVQVNHRAEKKKKKKKSVAHLRARKRREAEGTRDEFSEVGDGCQQKNFDRSSSDEEIGLSI